MSKTAGQFAVVGSMVTFRRYEPDQRGMGFRQLGVRGLWKVAGEFNLVCLALNLCRMATMIEWG